MDTRSTLKGNTVSLLRGISFSPQEDAIILREWGKLGAKAIASLLEELTGYRRHRGTVTNRAVSELGLPRAPLLGRQTRAPSERKVKPEDEVDLSAWRFWRCQKCNRLHQREAHPNTCATCGWSRKPSRADLESWHIEVFRQKTIGECMTRVYTPHAPGIHTLRAESSGEDRLPPPYDGPYRGQASRRPLAAS